MSRPDKAAFEAVTSSRWQTPQERAAYQQAQAELGALNEPTARQRALSSVVKGARLLERAEAGDEAGVRLWLAAGADPNHSSLKSPALALNHAINLERVGMAMALMEAGGRVKSARGEADPAKARSFARRECAARGSLEMMKAMTERFGDPSPAQWVEELFAVGADRFGEISFWLKAAGAQPSPKQWVAWVEDEEGWTGALMDSIYELGPAPDEDERREREQVAGLLREFGASAPDRALEALFAECALRDHAPGLRALLEAGLRPSADWRARSSSLVGDEREALLSIAALTRFKEGGSECFELLQGFEPARAAALARPMNPEDLSGLSVRQALAYAEAGFSIDGVDKDGDTVAHYWARGGERAAGPWKALFKARPDLALRQNHQGQSAFDILIQQESDPSRQQAYRQALAGAERKDLMKESRAAAPRKAKSGGPGARL